jgi:large subunit ribosomal protein L32
MAVPKKKTSKSRRDKRRGGHTHVLAATPVNVCPTCHQPKRPHRVCPTCGTYKGREVEPMRVAAP